MRWAELGEVEYLCRSGDCWASLRPHERAHDECDECRKAKMNRADVKLPSAYVLMGYMLYERMVDDPTVFIPVIQNWGFHIYQDLPKARAAAALYIKEARKGRKDFSAEDLLLGECYKNFATGETYIKVDYTQEEVASGVVPEWVNYENLVVVA